MLDDDLFIINDMTHFSYPVLTANPAALEKAKIDIKLWHRRYGHVSFDTIRASSKATKGLDFKEGDTIPEVSITCDPCEKGKPYRVTRKKAVRDIVVNPGEIIHLDVVKLSPAGIHGEVYGVLGTCEASSCRFFGAFAQKKEAFSYLKTLCRHFKRQFDKFPKRFRIDGGKEYSPSQLAQLADDLGQVIETTTPYTPNQDGKSEISIRIITERVRCVMIDQDIPLFLWPEIYSAMVHITNRCVTSTQDKTPYQVFLDYMDPGRKHIPSVSHLRVLGCKVYVMIQKEKRVQSEKLKPRAKVGILVGYEGKHIYRVYLAPENGHGRGKIVRSSHVRFDEGGLITDADTWDDPFDDDDQEVTTERGKQRNRDREIDLDEDALVPDSFNQDSQKTSLPGVDDIEIEEPLPEQQLPRGRDTERSKQTRYRSPSVEEVPDESFSQDFQDAEKEFPDQRENLYDNDLPDDVPEQEVPEVTESKKRGRPAGSKNKTYEKPAEPRYNTRRSRKIDFTVSTDLPQYVLNYIKRYGEIPQAFNQSYRAARNNSTVSDDPQTLEEAKASPNWKHWKVAIGREYKSLLRKKTWSLQKRSQVPRDQKVLRGKLVFKTKRDKNGKILKYKVRWVVRGFEQQYGTDYDQTYAGVCKSAVWKLAIALAANHDLEIEQMDAVTAFLNSEVDGDVYVELPPEWEENGQTFSKDECCKLLKALYGLKQSPRLWQGKLRSCLAHLGFTPLVTDQAVYINKKTGIMIVTYVDDMLILGKSMELINKLKKELSEQFECEDLGSAAYFLGVRITRDREARTISLCQDAYIKKILERFGMENCKSVNTPMASGAAVYMVPNTVQASHQDTTWYQSMVGSIMYLATHTRPDIAYTVSVLSRFLNNPSTQHIAAAKRVLQYLSGTIYLGIVFGGNGHPDDEEYRLIGYSDSDWGGDHSTLASTSGYVFFFGGGVIACRAKRQTTVAQSSTEAEYIALAHASMEAAWLRQVFEELGYRRDDVTKVHLKGDNQGSLALAENPEIHQRTKHIKIKYHYIREQVASGLIELTYVDTHHQIADGFTKPLCNLKHANFVDALRMRSIDIPTVEEK
jgi:hypothetical protein